jgi:hypothetical protein
MYSKPEPPFSLFLSVYSKLEPPFSLFLLNPSPNNSALISYTSQDRNPLHISNHQGVFDCEPQEPFVG